MSPGYSLAKKQRGAAIIQYMGIIWELAPRARRVSNNILHLALHRHTGDIAHSKTYLHTVQGDEGCYEKINGAAFSQVYKAADLERRCFFTVEGRGVVTEKESKQVNENCAICILSRDGGVNVMGREK